MPAETDIPRPSGLPIASTPSPTCSASLLPHLSTGRLRSTSTFNTARSSIAATATSLAGTRSPSLNNTLMSSAPSMTCLLVTMIPLGSMMKPEPWVFTRRTVSPGLAGWRNFQVEMFTTAGVAFCAAVTSPVAMTRANAGPLASGIAMSAPSTGASARNSMTPPPFSRCPAYPLRSASLHHAWASGPTQDFGAVACVDGAELLSEEAFLDGDLEPQGTATSTSATNPRHSPMTIPEPRMASNRPV